MKQVVQNSTIGGVRVKPTECDRCNLPHAEPMDISFGDYSGDIPDSAVVRKRIVVIDPEGKPICDECLAEELEGAGVLTARESEVAVFLYAGVDRELIAENLDLEKSTVDTYVSRIRKKKSSVTRDQERAMKILAPI